MQKVRHKMAVMAMPVSRQRGQAYFNLRPYILITQMPMNYELGTCSFYLILAM